MAKTVKVGNLYIEVPDDHILAGAASPASPQPTRAERPEVPSKPDEAPYRFQPNDPFLAGLDRIEALGNIDKVDTPWVQKAFFFWLVIFPLLTCELGAIGMLGSQPYPQSLRGFLMFNLLGLGMAAPYFLIWRRAKRAGK